MMKELKLWWSKGWVKNVIFLMVLAVLFLTDVGKWVRVQVAGVTLRDPDNEIEVVSEQSIHSYSIVVENADGESVVLSELAGRPIFLNFWASWCVPCLAEMGSLETLSKEFPEVEFLFITGENQSDFQRYLEKTSHDLPFYRQLTGIAPQLDHSAIPASFFINADGVVLYRHVGAADWSSDDVKEEFKKLLI